MKYDIIIIGGGASGLCTAIMSKTKNNKVLIIEHNDRVGKKILSTGNGKCNLTNRFCKVHRLRIPESLFDSSDSSGKTVDLLSFVSNPEGIAPYYSSSDNRFAERVISAFDTDRAIRFFSELGMIPLDKNGYIYPRSEQASAVLDLLRFKCEDKGIEILCGYQPMKVEKTKQGFLIDNEYLCERLVIATGGMNASKTGSDGSGYEIAKQFGHRLITPVPALCALKCSDHFFKELAGVRTDAELTLYQMSDENGSKKREELLVVKGNLQFNSYGISGIPVFQLSLLASRLLAEGKEIMVKINLLPELSEEELVRILEKKKDHKLLGVLNKKLANVIEKESYKAHPDEKEEAYALVFTHMLQRFKVHPVATVSFEEAQTTLGGVSTEEIDPLTMESRLVKNLFFTGEIIDVSGICGGYNLQWAWASAYAASCGMKRS